MTDWHALCRADELSEDSSKEFVTAGTDLFVVKKDGLIYAYVNHCPHLGVALNWQEDQFLDSDKALIQCATHGALFLIEDGRCVAGPCNGASLKPIETNIRDGQIFVKLASA